MSAIAIEPDVSSEQLIPIPGRCNAHRTDGSGLLCRNRAGKGTDHLGRGTCYKHCGNTPAMRAKARQDGAQDVLLRLAADSGTPVHNPAEALTRLAGDMRADYQAARQLVADLEQNGRIVTRTDSGPADVDPIVKLWERHTERLAKVLTEMTKLGLVERRIEIDQATQQILLAELRAVLVKQGIDAAQVLPELGARLRAIEAEAVEQ